MKRPHGIVLVLMLVVVIGSWFLWPRPHASGPELNESVPWVPPQVTWTPKSVYSEPHNQDMGHLWNDVRRLEHWDAETVAFILYCLSDPPVFMGGNWENADISQIQKHDRFVNAASIFAEHLQIGGTIDGASVDQIKAALVNELSNPVASVRAYAVVGLVGTNYLGDAGLRARIEHLATTDPDPFVRSVVQVQIKNLQERQSGTK
jgi:hypothetical protein